MPRALILRTFSHPMIWERDEHQCKYYTDSLKIIRIWEPQLLNFPIHEVPLALGIYTAQYFTHIDSLGRPAYQGTPGEDQISILELRPIEGTPSFGVTDEDEEGQERTRIAFNFRHKKPPRSRAHMVLIDEILVTMKYNEIGDAARRTQYSSLCFTLDLYSVIEIIAMR